MTMQSTAQHRKTLNYSVVALSGLSTGAAFAATSVLLLAILAF